MQTTIKKTSGTKARKEKLPVSDAPKTQDEKLKKTSSNSTPRNYLPKSTAADIYGIKKNPLHISKAPKKSPKSTTLINNVSPMKDHLNSSPSSTSYSTVTSTREKTKMASQKKVDPKTTKHSATRAKDFNVTVNSPVVKRRLYLDKEKSFIKEDSKTKVKKEIAEVAKSKDKKNTSKEVHNGSSKVDNERQRTKTRTLNEDEVKMLTPEVIDNNAEMLNLSRKLAAQPKAFFVDLDENKATKIEKQSKPKSPSDEEINYEDDFESYESDFDSYASSSPSEQESSDVKSDEDDGNGGEEVDGNGEEISGVESKETKDEEKMLDSGSFDLRDQRSATKNKPVLDFIVETAEGAEDKRSSLTDEGFQEMSSSSAVSSIRTVHVDVLERPLFIDFTKSKENKRRRLINARLNQRAKDLLSVITLHEMSYSLFEMKPISYDLYMNTFGRSNYHQIAVQTYDDGVTQEIQTEDIDYKNKWTQHPVDFTNNEICFNNVINEEITNINEEDYLAKITSIINLSSNSGKNVEKASENYKSDPLRVYLEQKDGAGPNQMLPYESYKSKLKNNEYNPRRLGRFLKKMECRISNILNKNSGNTELMELKMSKMQFSKGYVSISTKSLNDEKYSFLKNTKISKVYLSESKNNLIMTVHSKIQNPTVKKCSICLWDISVARNEPLKILTVIDSVAIGRFRGSTDGIFIAALEDSSIHLWDLSEEATWRADVASEEKPTKLVEVKNEHLTSFESDRELNQINSHVGLEEGKMECVLQACAFTNSACNMQQGDATSRIVGLEFTGDRNTKWKERSLVGQIAALENTGVLTLWSIVQEKTKAVPPDIGNAYWSKMKLERSQTIYLLDHIDLPIKDLQNSLELNLNTAKRRLQNRKQEKNVLKVNSRPKSAFDNDRPTSAASVKNKKVLPIQKDVSRIWESGFVCFDLKVMFWGNCDNFLIAKNCGEVLSCKRTLGTVKVNRFCVASDASSVTCLEVSPHKLPYYLAANDGGTISLCSLVDSRVLLALDCRNIPTQEVEKCNSDHKGRFIDSVPTKTFLGDAKVVPLQRISSISWSRVNPCCIFSTLDGSIVSWDLTSSDIYAKSACEGAATTCTAGDTTMTILTPDGDVQIHKLTNNHRTQEFLSLFEKYVALL